MTKYEAQIKQFSTALNRLIEVLNEPESSIVRDSAIQRFEFTIDLAWKTIKTFLVEEKGIICKSPKECFREAYKQGVIKYDDYWLNLVDIRNLTSHTYKESLAIEVFSELPKAKEHFLELLESLKNNNEK